MTDTFKRGLILGTIESVWLIGGFSVFKLIPGIPQASLRALTGLFGLIILFIGIFYGIRKARDHSEHVFTYWKAVKTGVVISLLVACTVSLFSLIYVTLINPDFTNDMVREAEQSLKQAGATPAEITQRLARVRSEFSVSGQVLASLIVQSTVGIILTLILSIFLRSRKASL